MTKKIDYNITCPKCGKAEDVSLYRIIWGETPGNRDKVFNNQINNFNCQDCGKISHVPVAFLYVHQSGSDSFAVWYEPTHDENIDSDIEGYKHLFYPPDNYYVTAPRINDYEELKETIIKFENKELQAKQITEARGLDKLPSSIKKKYQGGKNSNCYIATTVYGSIDHPNVITLRNYRDSIINQHTLGRIFVKFYYFFSPWIVSVLSENVLFKHVSKYCLDKLIFIIKK